MRKQRYFVFVLILLILSAVYYYYAREIHVPKQSTEILLNDLRPGQTINYGNITPGVTREDELIRLMGRPNTIKGNGDWVSYHYFDYGKEYFLFKNSVLQLIISNSNRVVILDKDQRAMLNDFSDFLGKPEVILPVYYSTPYLAVPEVFVYSQYGLAITENQSVYLYFIPMEDGQWKSYWQNFPATVDPITQYRSIDIFQTKPGESTRSDLIKALGSPDKIAEENGEATLTYDFNSDTLSSMVVNLDRTGTVTSIFVDINKRVLFSDVIAMFGSPDKIQLMPDENNQEWGGQALVYFSLSSSRPSCALPSCLRGKSSSLFPHSSFYPIRKS
jgi:hypothetical protein